MNEPESSSYSTIKTDQTISCAAFFTLAAATAFAAPSLEANKPVDLTPELYSISNGAIVSKGGFFDNSTASKVLPEEVLDEQGLSSVIGFAKNLMNGMQDIPPEFAEVIEEDFYDLL